MEGFFAARKFKKRGGCCGPNDGAGVNLCLRQTHGEIFLFSL
jgi:hypothetical protein